MRRTFFRLYRWIGSPPRIAYENLRQFERQRMTAPRYIKRARIEQREHGGLHIWARGFTYCPMLYRRPTRDRGYVYWYGIERVRRGAYRAANWSAMAASRAAL